MKRFLFLAIAVIFATNLHAAKTSASKAAVAAPSPLASRAALQALLDGGTAADAAVSASAVMAVNSPNVAGFGGGGFAVYYDRASDVFWTLDFRETSPRAIDAKMLHSATPPKGALVGVPGTAAGLRELHQKFGKLSWKSLLQPAIGAAKSDTADHDLVADVASLKEKIGASDLSALLLPKGAMIGVGAPLAQPALAQLLQGIAERGTGDFYRGASARQIVKTVRSAGGSLSLRDLSDYRAKWRSPLRVELGELTIIAPPPPAAGAAVVGQGLAILQRLTLAPHGHSFARIHQVAESCRRTFVEQQAVVGDPERSRFALPQLFEPARLDAVAKSIDAARATATTSLTTSVHAERAEAGESIVVIDSEGNIAVVSLTLGGTFGSGLVTPNGVLLNDAMNSFAPQGASGPNNVEAGKRPKSFLAPLIVLRRNRPYLALGAGGGAEGATAALQVLLALTVDRRSLDEATKTSRFHQAALPDEIVLERSMEAGTMEGLTGMGHPVAIRESIGSIQAVLIEDGRLVAVSDDRRQGATGGY